MIMPCMNSTSACDRGGSFAVADGGRLLLGLPGAPGCTTTGGAGSVSCARAAGQKKSVGALATRSRPHNTANAPGDGSLRLRGKRYCHQFGTLLNISFGFDESLPRNTNISKDSLQADGTCPVDESISLHHSSISPWKPRLELSLTCFLFHGFYLCSWTEIVSRLIRLTHLKLCPKISLCSLRNNNP